MIDGTGRDGDVDVRAHRVPPADIRDPIVTVLPPGGMPDLLARDQTVVLAPQQYLAEIPEVPAVPDHTVVPWWQSGEHG